MKYKLRDFFDFDLPEINLYWDGIALWVKDLPEAKLCWYYQPGIKSFIVPVMDINKIEWSVN